jgi:hypothetical protein
MPSDPAIDAALVATEWEALHRAVSPETYARAWSSDAPIGVEHLVAIMNGRPFVSVEGFLSAVVAWLEHRGPESPEANPAM